MRLVTRKDLLWGNKGVFVKNVLLLLDFLVIMGVCAYNMTRLLPIWSALCVIGFFVSLACFVFRIQEFVGYVRDLLFTEFRYRVVPVVENPDSNIGFSCLSEYCGIKVYMDSSDGYYEGENCFWVFWKSKLKPYAVFPCKGTIFSSEIKAL